MGRCTIMRYNVRRLGAILLGAICAASVALYAPETLEAEARTATPMSLSQWHAQRASEVQEDDVFGGWDCRINGNMRCGTWQYELICAPGHTDCVLEGVDQPHPTG